MTILDKEKLLKFIREKLKDLPTNETYEIGEIFLAIESGEFDIQVKAIKLICIEEENKDKI